MKPLTFLLISFCFSPACKAQIDSVESLNHLITLLGSYYTLGSFNQGCTSCKDCNFLLKDSAVNPMETRYEGYPTRLVGSCRATYLLKDLYRKDSILLSKLRHFDAEFTKMAGPGNNSSYMKLGLGWYKYYDEQLHFYGRHNGRVKSGFLIEQLDIAHILMDAKLEELEGIEEIFYFKR